MHTVKAAWWHIPQNPLSGDLNNFFEHPIYRVSQEECARLRESVPYVKVYRYNPKNLYPKLNGYGDNGQRTYLKVLRFNLLTLEFYIKF
jgi:hypothetical protein